MTPAGPSRPMILHMHPDPEVCKLLNAVQDMLPGWEFGVDTFPGDELINPGGAQAFLKRGKVYAHGEGRTPAEAMMVATIRALAQL